MTSFFILLWYQLKCRGKKFKFPLVRCLCQHFVFAFSSFVPTRKQKRIAWFSLWFSGSDIICKQKMKGQKFKWTQITLSIVSCKLDSSGDCCRSVSEQNIYIIIINAKCLRLVSAERWQIIKIIIIQHCRFISSWAQHEKSFPSENGNFRLVLALRRYHFGKSSPPNYYRLTHFII